MENQAPSDNGESEKQYMSDETSLASQTSYSSSSPIDYTELTLDQAWVLYKENGDMKARAFIARAYAPMVASLARRVMRKKPAVFDYEDLVQCGTIGLLDAIDKFSPSKKILFSTYAPTRIKGEILDSINRLDWTPRSVRERIRLILRGIEEFENAHGHTPDAQELAFHVALPIEKVREGLNQYHKTHIGLGGLDIANDIDNDGNNPLMSIVGAAESDSIHHSGVENIVINNHDTQRLHDALNNVLSSHEQKIMKLYYFERMNYTEIVNHLQLSRREVKDVIDRSLLKLREHMQER